MADLYCKHDTRISHFKCADCEEEQDAAREGSNRNKAALGGDDMSVGSFVDEMNALRSQLAAKDAEIEALKSKTPHTSCWAEIETLKARVKKAEREAHDALINLDESEECSAELFELCCDVLDGKPNAEKARNDLREHVEHVRKCRRGSCAVAIRGSQKARADAAERERDAMSAMLDRIASTVDDYFHAPAEENVADGVDALMEDKAEAEEALVNTAKQRDAAEARAEKLAAALREIADLFGALKRRAEALGPDYKFEPHYALKLSNDAEQLKRIAAAALEEER